MSRAGSLTQSLETGWTQPTVAGELCTPGRQCPLRQCRGGPGDAEVTDIGDARPPSHRTRFHHRQEPSQRKRVKLGRALQRDLTGRGETCKPVHHESVCVGVILLLSLHVIPANIADYVYIINNAFGNLHFSN